MSSPVRALAPVASPASKVANTKKRVLSDSEDTEQREAKRAKPEGDVVENGLRKDTKEKKKRRKKKRKVPVVRAQDGDGNIAPNSSEPSLRARSVTLPGSSASTPEPITKPAEDTNPHTTHRNPSRSTSRGPSPSQSSSSKGKGRATPDDAATQANQQQITDLQDQVSAKTTLVSQHEDLLSTFQQSLSCQICLDLMHKPFALAPCGHSACYGCLVNWFKAPPPDVPANEVMPVWLRKKTCPHCRTVVKERPIEIWTIKDMVATLVKSGLAQTALLPPPAPAADAPANTDPWAGIFRPAARNAGVFPGGQPPALLQQLMGLRDDEDGGIYRCIDCHHEIWDGACSECGRVYPGHDPQGPGPDELDEEDGLGHWGDPGIGWGDDDDDDSFDDDDDVGGWAGLDLLRHLFMPAALDRGSDEDSLEVESTDQDEEIDLEAERPIWVDELPGNRARIEHVEEGEGDEDEDEDEEEGYESSFIDDGNDGRAGGSHGRARARRRAPSIDLDGDEVVDLSEGEDGAADDEEDEDVQFVGFGRRRAAAAPRPRGRGAIVITSDEEEGEDGGGDYDGEGSASGDDNVDLAAEVAAREYEIYGDDGSVPRRRDDVYHDGYMNEMDNEDDDDGEGGGGDEDYGSSSDGEGYDDDHSY